MVVFALKAVVVDPKVSYRFVEHFILYLIINFVFLYFKQRGLFSQKTENGFPN